MNWFLEIFSTREDQVRLLTVMISAVVAIFVVLLNQWIMKLRAKNEFLVAKVEELFEGGKEYEKACKDFIETVRLEREKSPSTEISFPSEPIDKMYEAIDKMSMICGLYFKHAKFKEEHFFHWNVPIVQVMPKGFEESEITVQKAVENSHDHIEKSRYIIRSLCLELMRKHGF